MTEGNTEGDTSGTCSIATHSAIRSTELLYPEPPSQSLFLESSQSTRRPFMPSSHTSGVPDTPNASTDNLAANHVPGSLSAPYGGIEELD
jgi:hypothetical protein